MNQRFITVLAFAFLTASGASFVLYRLIAGRGSTANTPVVPVIVAARNLGPGDLLKDSDVRLEKWPTTPPAGAFRKKDELAGRGVVYPVYAGEPVIDSRLAPKGAGAGLPAMIPPGKRAVAVRVNEVVGLAGFVLPGMRVDVIISGNPPHRSEMGSMTRTALQNIEVLSAGRNLQKDVEGKPVSVQVVNLLVTPEEAEILSLASAHTSIQLVLRNPTDREVAKTSGTALARLFGQEPPHREPAPVVVRRAPEKRPAAEPPPAPPPKPVPFVVEVLHGAKRAETKFEATEGGDR